MTAAELRGMALSLLATAVVACQSPRSTPEPSATQTAQLRTRVTIATPESGSLAAELYGAGDHAVVILAHGGYSSLASWAPQGEALGRAGFRALVVEARAAADLAAGRETPCLYDEKCLARDVLAAMRHARRLGARRISLMAGSMGGAAVAQASVEGFAADVESIVLLAPASIQTPERMNGRKLFITTRDDANSAGPRLPGIQAQYDRTPEPKQLMLLDGSAHAQRIFGTAQGDRVLQDIIAFLKHRRRAD